MARIGFIGTGHIAAPMIRTLARDGHDLLISQRSEVVSSALAAMFSNVTSADNQAVVDGADIVFLSVRPQQAHGVIDPLVFRAGQQIVSVMAGVSMEDLASLCTPASDICMTIPLGYLEAGGCPLAVFPGAEPLAGLFGAANPVIPVTSEAALNSHFAVCAMVPGLLAMLEAGSDWLARRTGDADAAERYTTELAAGFLAAMEKGAGRLGVEKNELATEGTLSLMMVEALENAGALDAMTGAMDAIERRLTPDA
jgi:pyrroline-5-carboxylate reductase